MTEATVALAGVTFLLAIAAFVNICLTRRIQAKERRDRQLREVADWAVDASKTTLLAETPKPPPELATFEQPTVNIFLRDTFASNLAEERRHVGLTLAAGEYIRNLAGYLDDSLASAIEDALGTLTEHEDLLTADIDKLSEASGNLPRVVKCIMDSNQQSRQRVQDSAKAIISRATELLAT